MIGRGHGSAYLKIIALRLQAERVPLLAIDPAVANRRAISAYRNAGFQIVSTFDGPEGPGVLMILSPR